MIKACIFDLDGTLLDTIGTISHYGNMALKTYGIEPYETDAYKYMVGDGAKTLIKRMLEGRDIKDDADIFSRVFELYSTEYDKDVEFGTKVYEGVVELLKALKKDGIITAVLSNKPDFAAIEAVKTFLNGYFDVVHGQRENVKIKPAPDGVFEILKELNLNIDEVLYIGDTATDMKTGKSAGAYTVGVLWGFRDRAELEGANADEIIEHPLEILEIIKKLNG